MSIRLMGAATITRNDVSIGNSYGGASINILEETVAILDSYWKIVKQPYGIEGEINLFEITTTVDVSDDLTLFSYGVIKFTLTNGSLTLYNAKIFLPNSFSLGTFTQQPITVRLSGGVDSNGKLYKIN
jgi:hypothetical protein